MDRAIYLEHLQAVIKEFDLILASNEGILIGYFRKRLHPFIGAQLDNWGRDLDAWDEVVEKAVNIEVKAYLQPLSETREIDSRCPNGYKPSVKNNKNDAY